VEFPKQSRALIAAPNMPAKVYQVGDTLPGNATIERIAKEYVVINDNGTLEKLALPIKTLQGEG
jgi:general secretion pathway protein C